MDLYSAPSGWQQQGQTVSSRIREHFQRRSYVATQYHSPDVGEMLCPIGINLPQPVVGQRSQGDTGIEPGILVCLRRGATALYRTQRSEYCRSHGRRPLNLEAVAVML